MSIIQYSIIKYYFSHLYITKFKKKNIFQKTTYPFYKIPLDPTNQNECYSENWALVNLQLLILYNTILFSKWVWVPIPTGKQGKLKDFIGNQGNSGLSGN